jgi:hypothetical protein
MHKFNEEIFLIIEFYYTKYPLTYEPIFNLVYGFIRMISDTSEVHFAVII